MEYLGSRLEEIRKKLNMSQKDFANKLNFSQIAISNYENNKRTPDATLLNQIHKKFNIDLNWLISGNGTMFQNETQKEEKKPCEKLKEEMCESYDKLPTERQKYYYLKILAEGLDY